MKFSQYIGILLGGLYGLGYRILCEKEGFNGIYNDYDIYSISFIWIVPIVVGIIPLLIAKKEILNSRMKQFFFPLLSVLMFFILALSTGLEDWVCILIIMFPFLISAGFTGLVVGYFIKKHHSKNLLSIILIPLILNPIESAFPNNREVFTVETSVTIFESKQKIWDSLIEVPEIKEEEYEYGFFNYIGIPRPIKSELKVIGQQQYRIGHFTDDLKLYETISEVDSLNFVNFKIHLEESELRDVPTDNHVLKSNNFKFENISYQLSELRKGEIQLKLKCDYSIESKMNFYANFWARSIVKDFQIRLLAALKNKIEQDSKQREL